MTTEIPPSGKNSRVHESFGKSTALAPNGKYIYRVGGLSFINVEGEEDAIFNFDRPLSFATTSKRTTWTEMEPLRFLGFVRSNAAVVRPGRFTPSVVGTCNGKKRYRGTQPLARTRLHASTGQP